MSEATPCILWCMGVRHIHQYPRKLYAVQEGAKLRNMPKKALAMAGLVAVVLGAVGEPDSSASASAGTSPAPEVCPVTLPNHSTPPNLRDRPLAEHHGNGQLWTLLWPHGVVVAQRGQVSRDGSITMKFPWYRGVTGSLSIEGRRLDASAPGLRARISEAYGLSGFQPASIVFPSEGCWEVTGRVADASLTFVTIVIKLTRHRHQ